MFLIRTQRVEERIGLRVFNESDLIKTFTALIFRHGTKTSNTCSAPVTLVELSVQVLLCFSNNRSYPYFVLVVTT